MAQTRTWCNGSKHLGGQFVYNLLGVIYSVTYIYIYILHLPSFYDLHSLKYCHLLTLEIYIFGHMFYTHLLSPGFYPHFMKADFCHLGIGFTVTYNHLLSPDIYLYIINFTSGHLLSSDIYLWSFTILGHLPSCYDSSFGHLWLHVRCDPKTNQN